MTGKVTLSTREKRAWSKKLLEVQEQIEDLIITRNKMMGEAYGAGLSYAAIEASTGLGPQSVRNAVNDPERAVEGRKADS